MLMTLASLDAPDGGGLCEWLGDDSDHFAAASAFVQHDGSPAQRRAIAGTAVFEPGFSADGLQRQGNGVLLFIDDVMSRVAEAERDAARRLAADVALVAGSDCVRDGHLPGRIEDLAPGLAGETNAERRLLAVLAYRIAARGVRAEHAAQLAARALEGGHLLAAGVRSPALLAAGIALGLAGHTREAEDVFGAIAEHSRRTQSFAMLAASCGQRGVERYRRGALRAASADLQAALDASRGQPWETVVDDCRAHLLRVDVELGELAAADRKLEAWCATGPLPDTPFGNRLLIERGRLRLAQAHFDEAASDLESAGRRLGDRGDSALFEWRAAAALANLRLGKQQRAFDLSREDLDHARAWGASRQLGIATATLGLVEGGTRGIARMEDAVDILETSSAQLERARVMVSLGVVLRRNGEPSRARPHLRAGLEIAVGLGALAVANLARQELAATGISRRRRMLMSGPDSLTPSEHRVAKLALSGLSNPDIARALVVSRKTVEMHLGNAYRKLDIDSRKQLRSALSCGQPV
jgi:DNA-binding CsgD family transcriptional regulator